MSPRKRRKTAAYRAHRNVPTCEEEFARSVRVARAAPGGRWPHPQPRRIKRRNVESRGVHVDASSRGIGHGARGRGREPAAAARRPNISSRVGSERDQLDESIGAVAEPLPPYPSGRSASHGAPHVRQSDRRDMAVHRVLQRGWGGETQSQPVAESMRPMRGSQRRVQRDCGEHGQLFRDALRLSSLREFRRLVASERRARQLLGKRAAAKSATRLCLSAMTAPRSRGPAGARRSRPTDWRARRA